MQFVDKIGNSIFWCKYTTRCFEDGSIPIEGAEPPEFICVPDDCPSVKEVVKHGRWAHVFPAIAGKTDMRGIVALMLISTQEQEDNLADYAIALAQQLGSIMLHTPCPVGEDLFAVTVREFLKRGSQMWNEAGVAKVLKFVCCVCHSDREESRDIHFHFVNPQAQYNKRGYNVWLAAQVETVAASYQQTM